MQPAKKAVHCTTTENDGALMEILHKDFLHMKIFHMLAHIPNTELGERVLS